MWRHSRKGRIMRVTIKQLKSLISEAVRTAHVPSVKNHKSELARLKKIIKEHVEDAVSGVDPITKEAAALSPEEAKIELEELLRDAPPELIEKLQDMVRDPEFRKIKRDISLNENTHPSPGIAALGTALVAIPYAGLAALASHYGINDPQWGMSPEAVLTLIGLLGSATMTGITGTIISAIKKKDAKIGNAPRHMDAMLDRIKKGIRD